MNRIVFGSILAAILLLDACATSSTGIEIQTEDVDRFFQLYESASGRLTAEQIQRDYLDKGTAGLRHLTQVRNVNAENIARAVATTPELYVDARPCLEALPRVRSRLDAAFDKLLDLHPQAQKPPVTILVSRGRPLAIAGPGQGVQIAIEAMCGATADRLLDANVEDRFVHVIAHEYIHAQQAPELADTEDLTVLQRSLVEGIADFVGELISGGVANAAVFASAKGHETEIETRFIADADRTDLSQWFDNSTPDDVGQLGYWVGYRIAKSYYLRTPDKRAAVHEMIEMTDARVFLAKSGWSPGIVLNE